MGNTLFEGTIKLNADVANALNGLKQIPNEIKNLKLGKAFENSYGDAITRLTKNNQKMTEALTKGFN